MTEARHSLRRAAADGGLLALAALLVYLLLGQRTFYKVDGHLYLGYVLNGELSYPRHFLYLPMVAATAKATAPFGASLYESARLLSALGAAVGVWLFHLASATLELSRRQAALATSLIATTAPLVFFATIVEVHGSFFAFAGLAAWAAAALAVRTTTIRALLFGAACAVAFYAHSTGALLPALFLPLLLQRRQFIATIWPGVVTAVVLALGVWLAPQAAALVGVQFSIDHSHEFMTDRAARNVAELWRWGDTLCYEWLLPYLPVNLLVLFGLGARALRARTLWLLAAVVIYLVVTIMILGGEAEWGAYLLPCAWPIALLVIQLLPTRAVLVAAIMQLMLGVTGVTLHDDSTATTAHAAAARAAAGNAPIALLVADDLDLKTMLLHLPDAERLPLFELARVPVESLPQAQRLLDGRIRDDLAKGHVVLLSRGAIRMLEEQPLVCPSGPGLLTALRAYRWQPAPGYGFELR